MREDQARLRLKAAAEDAAVRGSLIFHLDLAMALGAEALAEAGIAAPLAAALVDEEGYGLVALDDGPVPQRRATVRFAPDGRPLVAAAGGAATAAEAARARAARTLAEARLTDPARGRLVVIPQRRAATPRDPIEGYALALPARTGDVVLGIHHHATLAGDGTRLLASEKLSRTALVIPGRPDLPPFGVEVTHFGAVPSEIHTWLSLKHGMSMAVAALESGTVWMVEGERTTLTGRSA